MSLHFAPTTLPTLPVKSPLIQFFKRAIIFILMLIYSIVQRSMFNMGE